MILENLCVWCCLLSGKGNANFNWANCRNLGLIKWRFCFLVCGLLFSSIRRGDSIIYIVYVPFVAFEGDYAISEKLAWEFVKIIMVLVGIPLVGGKVWKSKKYWTSALFAMQESKTWDEMSWMHKHNFFFPYNLSVQIESNLLDKS